MENRCYRFYCYKYIKCNNEKFESGKMCNKKMTHNSQNCCYCGIKFSDNTNSREPASRTIDHFIPKHRGGTSNPCNLLWCCKSCNEKKDSKKPKEWLNNSKIRKHLKYYIMKHLQKDQRDIFFEIMKGNI